MIEVFWELISTPTYLGVLMGASLLGMILGAIPGLGGVVGLTIILPFLYHLDVKISLILIIGMIASVTTGDTITCVLWGVPGSAGSQATVLDGYPLAKKGEAARALNTAYLCSMIGGIIGAICLLSVLPIAKILMLWIGSPELLMLSLLGLSMISALGGKSLLAGIALGFLGVAISMIGLDPQTGVSRWIYGQSYLLEGVNIVPVALGLFAIPEMADLFSKGVYLHGDTKLKRGIAVLKESVKDLLDNWFLILRCSLLGTFIGLIPAMGGAVANWVAYGHTVQVSKNKENFGKGDIRGVIGVESANNAVVGGALIPTILFGVPGSLTMVFILAAFTIHGIIPGPNLIIEMPNIFYIVIFSLALSNIFACLVGIVFLNQAVKVCLVPAHFLVPIISSAIIFASLQASSHMGDLYVLMIFGVIGWFLKKAGWARPALMLGIILGPILRQRFHISTMIYGLSWLTRPGVLIIGLLIAVGIYYAARSSKDSK
ncbi:MAG: tripartite tricarboxylate transporter permease [Bacillota bacterium]|nr:tripartite tricarboxylate transporter permease [Bacillota bacterium]